MFKKVFIALLICLSQMAFAVQPQLKKIKHSGSSDGLTRIDKEGVYIYETENPLKNQASHIRFGAAETPEMTVDICQRIGDNDCAAVSQVRFEDIYAGASKFSVGYDYEYFFSMQSGKLGAQIGASLQIASGHGRLASNPSVEGYEKFTFVTLPIYLGAVYRFQYKTYQLISPYVAGGGTYMILAEKRDDRAKVNAIGSFGFYGSGGVLLNITALDRDMASDMYNEYGVGSLWFNLELKTVQISSEAFNYSANYIQGGMSFDF